MAKLGYGFTVSNSPMRYRLALTDAIVNRRGLFNGFYINKHPTKPSEYKAVEKPTKPRYCIAFKPKPFVEDP